MVWLINKIIWPIKILLWLPFKIMHDFTLMLYDDLEYNAMSLPRFCAFIMSVVVVIAWFFEQFYSYHFDHFNALTGLAATAWGAYGVKKVSGKNPPE